MVQQKLRRDLAGLMNGTVRRTPDARRGTFVQRACAGIVSAVVVLLQLMPGSAQGQEYPMTNGTIITCSGVLYDSGGGFGPYGANENLTTTICPDMPGQGIYLSFVIVDLSTAGSAPGDQVIIYNGDNVGAPVLGSYTTDELEGWVYGATPDNPSGCLTVQFISNEAGAGEFAAIISCQQPCFPPTADAIVVNELLPALICQGEQFTLDGSGSVAASGQTITTYTWELEDGTTLNGPVQTTSFTEAGEYILRLQVTDDAGCVNTNPSFVAVQVSTTPTFAGTTGSFTRCMGTAVDLNGLVQGTTWTGLPEANIGDPIELPDNVGTPFVSSIEYSAFPFGAALNNVNGLESICVDIEHSYMGDLLLVMTCPNGQSVNLHQQGGGTTFLGDANDTEPTGTPAVPGTCFTYCFAPDATNGTWVEATNAGMTIPVSQGNALAPGTYESVEPLSDLVGCPLNGTWTFTIIDNLLADNGVICAWELNFDPALFDDITTFTPVIGQGPDSSAWSGPGVVVDPVSGLNATVPLDTPGAFDYTLSVTDNFGCTYDTTITITVTEPPVVAATVVPGSTCSDPASLQAAIVANPPPPPNCTYTVVLQDAGGDGWQGGSQLIVNVGGTPTLCTLPNGGTATYTINVQPGQNILVVYTSGNPGNFQNSFTVFGADGAILYASPTGLPTGVAWQGIVTCGPTVGPPSYSWTPAAGASTPTQANTLTQITEETTFVVRVTAFGQPWCFTTDTVVVQPPSALANDSLVVHALCADSLGSIVIGTAGLGSPWNYRWTDADGNVVREVIGSIGDTLNATAGTYQVVVTESAAAGCIDSLTATILEPAPLEWVTTPTDTLICLTGEALLAAQVAGGTAPIQLIWDQGLLGNGPHSVSPIDSTVYSVVAVDDNGCRLDTVQAVIGVNPALTASPLVDVTECIGIPIAFAVSDAAGGDGDLWYDWGTGPGRDSSFTITPLNDTTLCITVSDGCETPVVTSCANITLLRTPPMVYSVDTAYGCDPLGVVFSFVDTTGGALIRWDLGDGTAVDGDTSLTHVYEQAGNFDVSVEVEWPNGCITDTTMVDMVRVLTVPTASFTWSPRPTTILEPTVTFEDLSFPNVVSWSWNFHDSIFSNQPDTVITYPDDVGDTYPVTLVVSNELGCSDSLLLLVEVEDQFLVFIPNTFTPSGDDLNETWGVVGNDISEEEYELRVFDRWGGEVFAADKPWLRWDGRLNGALLPQGVYTYRLSVRSRMTQQEKIIFGHVNLLH
jgi:gliding motility-associated-like protein